MADDKFKKYLKLHEAMAIPSTFKDLLSPTTLFTPERFRKYYEPRTSSELDQMTDGERARYFLEMNSSFSTPGQYPLASDKDILENFDLRQKSPWQRIK